MLVLTRKVGESIRIGDSIMVEVVKISGQRATIAIEAPRRVVVDRSEIWLRKHTEGAQVSLDSVGATEVAPARLSRRPPR
jgi:carbon storage regulator